VAAETKATVNHTSESRSFFDNVRTISLCTLSSRVLGLLRDVLCAAVYGDSWVWSAFSLAFRVPNLFRRLFGEGAVSAAFVPVLTETIERQGWEEAFRVFNVCVTLMVVALSTIVVLGELAFWLIPHATTLKPTLLLALRLLPIMFPYMLLICLVALAMAMLNTLGHFFTPAFAPVLLNVFWIAGLVIVAPRFGSASEHNIFGLAWVILAAGVAQLAIQWLPLRRRGVRVRLDFAFRHEAIRTILRRMGPVVFGLAVMQVNVLLDSLIAVGFARPPDGPDSFPLLGWVVRYPLETGANAILYYADRLYQFPLGVFGLAVATAVLPRFSRHAVREDHDGLREALRQALGLIVFVGVPASVGMIVLREPIIQLLFQRGKFTAESVARACPVLLGYSCGIWAYCGVHVLVRAFHALKDTKTPVVVGTCMVVLNIALNLTLIWFLRVAGLAFATAISSSLQLVALFVILRRQIDSGQASLPLGSAAKTLIATAVMGLVCHGVLQVLPAAASGPVRLPRVGLPMCAAMVAYALAAWALRIDELVQVL